MSVLSDSDGLDGGFSFSETITGQDAGNRSLAGLLWDGAQANLTPILANSAGGVGREGAASPQDRTNNVIIQSGKEPLWPVTIVTAITTL